MENKDTGADRRRVQEDDYFRRRDQELMEEQRRRVEVVNHRHLMAEAIGVADDEVLIGLQTVGYEPDTIVLLTLAPPVHVAWADGSVSKRERDVLLQLATRDNIVESGRAHAQLNTWLEDRPADAFFQASLRGIAAILRDLPPEIQTPLRLGILDDCTTLAVVSGGFLGLGQVSQEENRVIDAIVSALSRHDEGH